MLDEGEERDVEESARWHARVNGFKSEVARVLAYKHAGFSDSAIARHLETTENTVENYLNRVVAVYGPEAAMVAVGDDADRVDYDPVTAEEIADWSDHYQQWWLEAGREPPTIVPRDLRDRFEANRK